MAHLLLQLLFSLIELLNSLLVVISQVLFVFEVRLHLVQRAQVLRLVLQLLLLCIKLAAELLNQSILLVHVLLLALDFPKHLRNALVLDVIFLLNDRHLFLVLTF